MPAFAITDVPCAPRPVLVQVPAAQAVGGLSAFLGTAESERRLGDILLAVRCRLAEGVYAIVPPAWISWGTDTPLPVPPFPGAAPPEAAA